MTRLDITQSEKQDVFAYEPDYRYASAADLDASDRVANFAISGAGLDYVMLLADAKYIARKAGTYTEAQRISIFNTIAVLQCAIREEM